MDIAKLEAAALAALDKIGKPSWRSPTWWVGTVAPQALSVLIAGGILVGGGHFALIVSAALALAASIVAHIKDGWIKIAIASAPEAWALFQTIHSSRSENTTMAIKTSSLDPPVLFKDTASGAIQVADAEDPK